MRIRSTTGRQAEKLRKPSYQWRHINLLSGSLAHTYPAWQCTDGCHEKLGLIKAVGERVKDSKHRQKLPTTHFSSAESKCCIISAPSQTYTAVFRFPFHFHLSEGRKWRSTQTLDHSPLPPASLTTLGERRNETSWTGLIPTASPHTVSEHSLFLWLKQQNKNGIGLLVMTQSGVE